VTSSTCFKAASRPPAREASARHAQHRPPGRPTGYRDHGDSPNTLAPTGLKRSSGSSPPRQCQSRSAHQRSTRCARRSSLDEKPASNASGGIYGGAGQDGGPITLATVFEGPGILRTKTSMRFRVDDLFGKVGGVRGYWHSHGARNNTTPSPALTTGLQLVDNHGLARSLLIIAAIDELQGWASPRFAAWCVDRTRLSTARYFRAKLACLDDLPPPRRRPTQQRHHPATARAGKRPLMGERGAMLRVCRCGKLIPATRRRCPTCDRAESARRRNKPSGKVYADPRWRKTRQLVLDRDDHTCQVCGAPATHVDHQPPITVLLARGDSPFDPVYCRACCASCAGRADAARAHPRGGGLPIVTTGSWEIPHQLAARKTSDDAPLIA
jgi:5-methylcytosine-specific restriction endonuclease McrA